MACKQIAVTIVHALKYFRKKIISLGFFEFGDFFPPRPPANRPNPEIQKSPKEKIQKYKVWG